MNFVESYTLKEGIVISIGIGIYTVAFLMVLVWLWVTRDKNTAEKY